MDIASHRSRIRNNIPVGLILANVVVVGGAAYAAFLLVYAVRDHERLMRLPAAAVTAYTVLALATTGLVASLRLPPRRRMRLALVMLGTMLGVAAVEASLEMARSAPQAELERQRREAAGRLGVAFDPRTPREVIAALRAQGIRAHPVVHPRSLLGPGVTGALRSAITLDGAEALPLGGIADTVTVACNELGQYLIYQSDKHGFHNPPGIWGTARAQVVALGDSFTQGYCVPSDRNFVALIRERFPATLNLGMAGSEPLIMLATVKEYARAVQPKVVLWFHYEGNDLRDLRAMRQSPLLMRYLGSEFRQGLLARPPELDKRLTDLVEARLAVGVGGDRTGDDPWPTRLARLTRLGNVRTQAGLVGREPSFASELPLFEEILRDARETVRKWGGALHFVYLPEWPGRRGLAAMEDRDRDQVVAVVRRVGLPLIDVHRAFHALPQPTALFPFGLFGHYSLEGNRVVAQEVMRALADAR